MTWSMVKRKILYNIEQVDRASFGIISVVKGAYRIEIWCKRIPVPMID